MSSGHPTTDRQRHVVATLVWGCGVLLTWLLVFTIDTAWGGGVPSNPVDQAEAMAKAVVEKDDPRRNQMFLRLRQAGKEAVPAVLPLLKDSRPGVAEYAAFTLGWLADPSTIPALVAMLDPAQPARSRAALRALGNMKALSALPAMRPFLKHADARLRGDAAYSLGLMRHESVLADLRPLATDSDELVRFLATEAIRRVETGW